MAFTQLLAIANRSTPRTVPDPNVADGTPGVSPAAVVPAGTRLVTFRLTSNSWPPGTGNAVLYGLDVSSDGATWRVLAPPESVAEGVVAVHGGLMPQITWDVAHQYPPPPGDVRLRARYAVPQGTLRFGLEWELTP